MSTSYRIYASPAPGDPIDYATPVAAVAGLSWDTPPLTAGVWRFGVRAFDTVSGLEESNVDAAVAITIAADLSDVTGVPLAPSGLVAYPTAGGGIRVAWSFPTEGGRARPAGFHVYKGTSGTVDYGTVTATVLYGGPGPYTTTLAGLADGTEYTIGVRAYGATGLEEANAATVRATADGTPPDDVEYLTAT